MLKMKRTIDYAVEPAMKKHKSGPEILNLDVLYIIFNMLCTKDVLSMAFTCSTFARIVLSDPTNNPLWVSRFGFFPDPTEPLKKILERVTSMEILADFLTPEEPFYVIKNKRCFDIFLETILFNSTYTVNICFKNDSIEMSAIDDKKYASLSHTLETCGDVPKQMRSYTVELTYEVQNYLDYSDDTNICFQVTESMVKMFAIDPKFEKFTEYEFLKTCNSDVDPFNSQWDTIVYLPAKYVETERNLNRLLSNRTLKMAWDHKRAVLTLNNTFFRGLVYDGRSQNHSGQYITKHVTSILHLVCKYPEVFDEICIGFSNGPCCLSVKNGRNSIRILICDVVPNNS